MPERDTLFVQKLLALGFTYMEIAEIERVIDEVCKSCWDGPSTCKCMRDD